MSIFEAVKQSVTTRQAAERYGIRVERNGMCRCPFHDDSTPSMKLDRRYYCFGCGATGDVIDFVSRLRGISSKEAAILLAQDFAILYESSADKPCKPQKQNTEEQNYQHMERYCFRVLLDYYRLVWRWKEDYAPQTQPARDGTYLIEGACSHTEVAPYLEQYVKPEAARWHTLDDIAKTLDGCIAKLAEADQTVNTKYFRELVM